MRGVGRLVAGCCWAVGALAACAPPGGARFQPAQVEGGGVVAVSPASAGAAASPASEPGAPLPVEAEDAVWGRADAPVTLVLFTDLQCPFCGRLHATLTQLRERYGEARLRIVYKHAPLPFHRQARGAAELAQAALQLGGFPAFDAFMGAVFAAQPNLDDAALDAALTRAGVSPGAARQLVSAGAVSAKIDRDLALGERLGVRGVPASWINGRSLTGAQPLTAFTELVDAELVETAALARSGVPQRELSARRTALNAEALEPPPRRPEPEGVAGGVAGGLAEAESVWNVDVRGAPARGPSDALVTIVEFMDHQCPFCKKVEPTLEQLVARYPKELRLVVRLNPLPFHDRAVAAANFAYEARRQRGDEGFFAASRALFGAQSELQDETLWQLAKELGLNLKLVQQAVAQERHRATIEADQVIARGAEATGTPVFFINGRLLSGARPLEDFVSRVEAELVRARALVASGVAPAQVYERTVASGKTRQAPETKQVPAPTAASPSRGEARAPVVLQVFSDFQCPFCKKLEPTLDALLKAYPKQLRVVWRNLPLPFHEHARLAAAAALEAKAQRGDAGFWKMHARLFEAAAEPDGLARAQLVGYAKAQGLDVARFEAALADGRHDAAIDADVAIAEAAGIRGTPGTLVGPYFVSGARPLPDFQWAVQLALEAARQR